MRLLLTILFLMFPLLFSTGVVLTQPGSAGVSTTADALNDTVSFSTAAERLHNSTMLHTEWQNSTERSS